MAQFKPKRWQVEDRCGLCNVEFSLMNTRHHCRSCGRSVCGKHSRNKVIVPTSLSKVPQRVCDKCYPNLETNGRMAEIQEKARDGRRKRLEEITGRGMERTTMMNPGESCDEMENVRRGIDA
ncbi:Hypothetical protein PHPALM_38148 [Phytophthora palmivora]|uniref:FYVE-type domain-containing protein n=1 Tax=Phytophthora palmivora TaxID=4796 RepID=A0A2P4WVM9_9STRA|nr:Hypothetical protein PHPALM_38148 [Phytophthora palmivora]